MNEIRMNELQDKAMRRGLSDAEASELGRLIAEAEGKPYSNTALERKKHVAAAVIEEPRRGWMRRALGRLPSRRLGTKEASPAPAREDLGRKDDRAERAA